MGGVMHLEEGCVTTMVGRRGRGVRSEEPGGQGGKVRTLSQALDLCRVDALTDSGGGPRGTIVKTCIIFALLGVGETGLKQRFGCILRVTKAFCGFPILVLRHCSFICLSLMRLFLLCVSLCSNLRKAPWYRHIFTTIIMPASAFKTIRHRSHSSSHIDERLFELRRCSARSKVTTGSSRL